MHKNLLLFAVIMGLSIGDAAAATTEWGIAAPASAPTNPQIYYYIPEVRPTSRDKKNATALVVAGSIAATALIGGVALLFGTALAVAVAQQVALNLSCDIEGSTNNLEYGTRIFALDELRKWRNELVPKQGNLVLQSADQLTLSVRDATIITDAGITKIGGKRVAKGTQFSRFQLLESTAKYIEQEKKKITTTEHGIHVVAEVAEGLFEVFTGE